MYYTLMPVVRRVHYAFTVTNHENTQICNGLDNMANYYYNNSYCYYAIIIISSSSRLVVSSIVAIRLNYK